MNIFKMINEYVEIRIGMVVYERETEEAQQSNMLGGSPGAAQAAARHASLCLYFLCLFALLLLCFLKFLASGIVVLVLHPHHLLVS